MTPNARKNTARAYQRRHHVPYTEALRAVTPAGTLDDNAPHRGVPSADRRLLDALHRVRATRFAFLRSVPSQNHTVLSAAICHKNEF